MTLASRGTFIRRQTQEMTLIDKAVRVVLETWRMSSEYAVYIRCERTKA
jgi:hypothetical protein